jgi:cyclic-di-GMP phosphodiesterase TipF (flagellum assembly factor)
MTQRRNSLIGMAAYLCGGVALAITGPALWDVHPLIATVAASATSLTFMLVHLVLDTRALARAAAVEAKRRRSELLALGKYVTALERRLTNAPSATAARPVDPVLETQAVEPAVTDNLLRFAERVAARCGAGAAADGHRAGVVPDDAVAVGETRLELHLQPIVRLPQRATAHYQALARFRDADGNVMSPERLPAASAQAAVDLDTRQLAHVVSLCNRIGNKHAGTRIFCGLSADALRNDDFRAELNGFMETHPALAQRLVFEMDTATVLALNAEAVADLRALEDIGFAFAVGGATLPELGKLFNAFGRLAFAKIDADKLAGVDPNIVRALAKAGTQIVATNVVAEDEAVSLAAAGIGCAQGPLFGGPRKAKTAAEPLRLAA